MTRDRTRDDFPVSTLTDMCEHHDGQAMAMIAQVLDDPEPDTDDTYNVGIIRGYLERERLTCIAMCGRA